MAAPHARGCLGRDRGAEAAGPHHPALGSRAARVLLCVGARHDDGEHPARRGAPWWRSPAAPERFSFAFTALPASPPNVAARSGQGRITSACTKADGILVDRVEDHAVAIVARLGTVDPRHVRLATRRGLPSPGPLRRRRGRAWGRASMPCRSRCPFPRHRTARWAMSRQPQPPRAAARAGGAVH